MRTKTLALSAVLGMLGSASLVAQVNVYSLNSVGYINVSMPSGFSIVTCPLICGTEVATAAALPYHVTAGATLTNDLNTVLNNNTGVPTPYAGATVYQYTGGVGYSAQDSGNPGGATYGAGWQNGGQDVTLAPGQAVFFFNPNNTAMTATFVGTVPQGTLVNALAPGYNLVGSIVPTSGDLAANSITAFNPTASAGAYPVNGDYIYFYNPTGAAGDGYPAGFDNADDYVNSPTYGTGWAESPGTNPAAYSVVAGSYDPTTTSVSQGFFYYNYSVNTTPVTENWTEVFSINP
jgi:hypothetical protein